MDEGSVRRVQLFYEVQAGHWPAQEGSRNLSSDKYLNLKDI
jgi:hypothetical protein